MAFLFLVGKERKNVSGSESGVFKNYFNTLMIGAVKKMIGERKVVTLVLIYN